ncbi:MAG: IPT/TIG domain-containing protein [Thermoplasmatota archaeon]
MTWKGIFVFYVISLLLFTSTTSFTAVNSSVLSEKYTSITMFSSPQITSLSQDNAYPGESITIYGSDFGSTPGYIVITGLSVEPTTWSETSITITIPQDATSGFLYIRNKDNIPSNSVDFTVNRQLDPGLLEPATLRIADTGLSGFAFLVETDGEYIYGITGFETLIVYKIHENSPHEVYNRIYLPQRVGDLKLYNGYLFISGDHGLFIYRCSDLQQGKKDHIIAIAGGHFLGVDIREKPGAPINGVLVAICDYLPVLNTQELRVLLYRFQDEELTFIGSYSRIATINTPFPSRHNRSEERQLAIAIDPLHPKVYVSGYETLFGNNKYILEISFENLDTLVLNHIEETGNLLPFDMEAREDILWVGAVNDGVEIFRTYRLHSGNNHLVLDQIVQSTYGLGRPTRVKILDDQYTVGVAWAGARPDIFLMDTFNSGSTPLASYSSVDWAFDIAGFTVSSNNYDGKIIVADEWAGFCTYNIQSSPYEIIHQPQNWLVTTAMTQNIHLSENRLYIANRGAGVVSADRYYLGNEDEWRYVAWDWDDEEPQPHPISGLAIREDPDHGTLIAALGHDKAMAWGHTSYGILYKETSDEIVKLAISESFAPPGFFNRRESVVWPESDLVFMTSASDGFRAYVVNPDEPSITLHIDCQDEGFATDIYSTSNSAVVMQYYYDGSDLLLLIGSIPGLLVGDPTFNIFKITFPQGVPDRNYPNRPIIIEHEKALSCSSWKHIDNIALTDSGLIALATSQGIAVFHISWIDQLNDLFDFQAWAKINIPTQSFSPWWDDSWSNSIADVGFIQDTVLYCVKKPQEHRIGGVWELSVDINWNDLSHTSNAQGYYPGVQCGTDYNRFLQGWTNPDIITLHHPYALVTDANGVYVTGWSGKVQKISNSTENQPPDAPFIQGETNGKIQTLYNYTFSTLDPDNDNVYYFIDWGDGINTGWIGPYASGEQIIQSHMWSQRGDYEIKAMAKDIHGDVSEWGILPVSMPVIHTNMFYFFITSILQRFPNIFPIIRLLIPKN